MKIRRRRFFEISALGLLAYLLAVILFLLSQNKEVLHISFYCKNPVTPLLIAEAHVYGETRLATILAALSVDSGECVSTPDGEKQSFPPLGRVATFGKATNGGFIWRVHIKQRAGNHPFGYAIIFEKGTPL